MKQKFYTFLVAILLMITTSAFAQDSLQVEEVRFVPTVEGDASTEFLLLTHSTGSEGTISIVSDELIESTRDGAFCEYQIISQEGGSFNAVIQMGTQKSGASVNIGTYKTETESWTPNGDTIAISQEGWNDTTEYRFPITLEANVYYTLRINFLSSTGNWVGNVHKLYTEENDAAKDATLSDLTADAVTIADFGKYTLDYTITLDEGTTEVPVIAAVATQDGLASVDITQAETLSDTAKIVVTAGDGVTQQTYTVAFLVAGARYGTPMSIPGLVEFEDWDLGGEGYGYHDNDASPATETNGDRINVAYIAAGEWLNYSINAVSGGEFQLRTNIASNGGGDITLYIDDDSISTYTPTITGAWQEYSLDILDTVAISAGDHDVKFEISGETVALNFDYFVFLDIDNISSDASLASGALSDTTNLTLVDGQTSYEIIVDSLQQIPTDITAIANDPEATVTVSQASQVDSSTATIYVMAQDLISADTITITFVLPSSVDTTLASITINDEALEGFDPAVQDYNVALAAGTTEIPVVLATATDVDGATVTVTNASEIPGTATILVQTTDGGEATYTINFTISTSINTVKTEFELYPNPVSDVLNISSSVEVLKVQIYSITGAEVKNLSGNQTSVNVSDLTGGIYFVAVTTEEGTITQKITIK